MHIVFFYVQSQIAFKLVKCMCEVNQRVMVVQWLQINEKLEFFVFLSRNWWQFLTMVKA